MELSFCPSIFHQLVLKKTSVALENTVEKMKKKTEKTNTSLNAHSIQPIESGTRETKAPTNQTITKVCKYINCYRVLRASVYKLLLSVECFFTLQRPVYYNLISCLCMGR